MVRWRGRKQSDNVDDRRSQGGGGFGFPFPRGGGRRIRIPMGRGRGGRGLGLWGTLILLGLVYFFGGNLGSILGGGGGGRMPAPQVDGGAGQGGGFNIPGLPGTQRDRTRTAQPAPRRPAGQQAGLPDDQGAFISVIFKDTEDVWKDVFRRYQKTYREPQLVLYRGRTRTGCGTGSAAMGPFYCPLDQKVYIDLSFFDELARRFGAPGDFARAYVIAHEVGHHVQTLFGIAEAVQRAKQRQPGQRNAIQVRMELQADCLAGLWAKHADRTKQILEPGDIDEGLNAAAQIGDDMIQKRSGQRVNPHNFTHGSAAQRQRWFKRGFQSGEMNACDTFGSDRL